MKLRLLTAMVVLVAACHRSNGGSGPPPSGGPTAATVHEILISPALVGHTVSVTGRCLGYSSPTIAKGSSPLTRSDWQLEDQGEAIWVSGALPPGCSATQPAPSPSTITGLVVQDTLASLGGNPGVVRQYVLRP